MAIYSHTGTHIDAPRHFLSDGITIDAMPLDTIIGTARIIETKDPESIKTEELVIHDIQPGERILFKTRNSYECYKQEGFVKDYVYISTEAAKYLAERKVSVVGIDYYAIGSFYDTENLKTVHKIFADCGIWVLEAINLSAVKPGVYEIICLPIKLENGDAGPARAIIRPI